MPKSMPPICFPPSEASQLIGFSGNRLDRAAGRRDDAAWVSRQATADGMGLYLFLDGRIVADISDPRRPGVVHDRNLAATLGAAPEEFAFLGLAGTAPRFAAAIAVDEDALRTAGPLKSVDFRSLVNQGVLGTEETGAMAEARSLALWHQNHRFCAKCGAPTGLASAGWRRDCGRCGAMHFPRTDPVVIMLVIDGDRCLLGRQDGFLPGMYSALAGYVEPGETIEDAVRREIREEAGIETGRVGYYASQPWPFPSTLMIGCFAEAATTEIDFDGDELQDCRWFGRRELSRMIDRTHPDGLIAPLPLAIAHWLARAFIEAE